MNAQVYRGNIDDIPALMEINASSPFGHSEAVHRRKISETLIVKEGQLAVAYAMWGDQFWPDEDRQARFLHTVNVHREYRRHGYARLAIEGVGWMVLDGDDLHQPGRFLTSSTDVTNTASRSMHQRLGFKHIGTLELPDQDKAEMFYARDFQLQPPLLEAKPI